MATKNNPGKFDCYANAEPDEPMFVLLARDKHAPTLIWLWSCLREIDGEDPEKVAEARNCCASMLLWAQEHKRSIVGIGQAALVGVMDLIRQANIGVEAAGKATNTPTPVEFIRSLLCKTTISE